MAKVKNELLSHNYEMKSLTYEILSHNYKIKCKENKDNKSYL